MLHFVPLRHAEKPTGAASTTTEGQLFHATTQEDQLARSTTQKNPQGRDSLWVLLRHAVIAVSPGFPVSR